jgi:hypothetical protein
MKNESKHFPITWLQSGYSDRMIRRKAGPVEAGHLRFDLGLVRRAQY